MNLLSMPSIATATFHDLSDLITKPLPATTHHQYCQLAVGDNPLATVNSSATAIVAPTVVASATATTSNSVPCVGSKFAPTLPTLDTGASLLLIPFASDFLLVTPAPFGSALVVKPAPVSTPVNPYTLITGEDTGLVDLSSTDPSTDSDSVLDFGFELATASGTLEFQEFGAATLVFYYSGLKLVHISVEPDLDRFDWLHWVPLPRLIIPESYFHIFGLDYFQAFALFHLIPIWIYCLLHFAYDLE